MTREREIERIKRDFKEKWPELEGYPEIQKALDDHDPVKLGEIASMLVHGYWFDPGSARRASHPFVILINSVGLDFKDLTSALEFIACYKAANPTDLHISIFKRCAHGKIEIVPN